MSAELETTKHVRVHIACDRCKQRKKKCDGAKPKCGFCSSVPEEVECSYSPERRMRGAGRSHGPLVRVANTEKATAASSEDQPTARSLVDTRLNLIVEKLPLPLRPNSFPQLVGWLNAQIAMAEATGGYVTLLPEEFLLRIIRNTYDDVTKHHKPIELPEAISHAEAQISESLESPSTNMSRWALVSSLLALALRVKVADGSEDDFKHIISAYYHSSTKAIDQAFLEQPSCLSVQALMVTSMAAKLEPDTQVAAALAAKAIKQADMLMTKVSININNVDFTELERVRRVHRSARLLAMANQPT